MSTTAPKPVTTPIPVQLSEPECTAFLLPHLSMPKRGPKCKLGYDRVFHLILWGRYPGMQWKCLPMPHDTQGTPAIHDTTVYVSPQKFGAESPCPDGLPRRRHIGIIARGMHTTSSSA